MPANGDSAWQAGLEVVRVLETAGHAAYLVGGCVRDRQLGRPLHDIDIATSACPEDVMSLFSRVVPTGLQHGTVTVVLNEQTFEVTTFRQETGYSDSRHPDAVTFVKDVREDLARRDFTINAMAVGSDGAIVDPFGGAEDLKRGVVRCVGDARERFAEDALRMVRAVRFAAELGFAIDDATWDGLLDRREGLRHVAMERIGAELDKMVCGSGADRAIALLKASGLLACAREPLPWLLPAGEGGLRELAHLAPPELRWAALPLLAGANAEQALAQARALRFSAKRAEAAAAIVRLHRRLAAAGFWPAAGSADAAGPDVAGAKAAGATSAPGSKLAWTRAVLDAGEAAARAWLRLIRQVPQLADAPREAVLASADRAEDWLAGMPALRAQDLAIRGDEVVRLAGRSPGPWVAALLRQLLERVALGELPNEPKALKSAIEQSSEKGD